MNTAPAASSALAGTDIAELLKTADQACAQGRHDIAIAALEAARGLAEANPEQQGSEVERARLHAAVANALMAVGQAATAAEHYKAALRLAPHLTGCWCNLGVAHLQQGKAAEAIDYLLQAISRDPAHWASRTNLVKALIATKQYLVAKQLLIELAGERPHDGRLQHDLGTVSYELQQTELAIEYFNKAYELDPTNAEPLYWIGGIYQSEGNISAAQAAYVKAAAIRPIIHRPAVKEPADFKVLALYAPFAGNTPAGYLFKNVDYDTDTLALLPSTDIAVVLPATYSVVVNLISDADQSAEVLPVATELAERPGAPIVNHPAQVARTTRDATYEMLAGIPACRIPKTFRLVADQQRTALGFDLAFPLLVRPAGTHGGDHFEKVEDVAALDAELAAQPDGDHYLIEYIDYRSADGYFRKYRFIFVAGEIFPYHLAVGRDWKLHRDSADMRDLSWVRDEERSFLEHPDRFFDKHHMEALRMIAARIGLEYFGVDCGLNSSGDLVLFEVNASMLVHGEDGELAYKDPFIRKIKTAFNAMLARLAGHPGASSC
ncbi:MAG: tetratricopeptide repeat protein [Bradyrhizobium sp.]|uniref:ATP-grasp domain-containing protein n=1 Tax=Bradyrhizobium sp. TaxID=376 RepID=UPI003C7AA4C1